MPDLLGGFAMGRWFSLSAVWRKQDMADGKASALRGMPVQVVVDGGDHVSRHAEAVDALVPCDLVGGEPKERGERQGDPADSGAGQLRNRVGVAAQTASCDGST